MGAFKAQAKLLLSDERKDRSHPSFLSYGALGPWSRDAQALSVPQTKVSRERENAGRGIGSG